MTHIPFAFAVTGLLRPRVIVELGTHAGDSYLAFCQAVAHLGLPTACYAVDTWEGDPHAGTYGPKVLEELAAYHDPRYGGFSTLLRMNFDDALSEFVDGTVDLLHIDGYHSYDHVRHDFESWQPRLSERGVVLFHDINVHERDFGVFRFWAEVENEFPSFAFLHGHGLGVLGAGQESANLLAPLLTAGGDPFQTADVRAAFSRLGDHVASDRALSQRGEQAQVWEQRYTAAEEARERSENERARCEAEILAREAQVANLNDAVREVRESASWRVGNALVRTGRRMGIGGHGDRARARV